MLVRLKESCRSALWFVRRMLWRRRVSLYGRMGLYPRMRRRQHGSVRILTYHGVAPEKCMGRPWIPHYFISDGLLDRHLTWLKQAGDLVSIQQAMEILLERSAPRDLVYVVTFDDGFYNNLSIVAPLLASHGVSATVFIATGLCDPGGQTPLWIQSRFMRHLQDQGRLTLTGEQSRAVAAARSGGRTPPYDILPVMDQLWRDNARHIDPAAIEATRMATSDELRRMVEAGMTLGAHTVNHVHLAGITGERRRAEIRESVESIRAMTERHWVAFAYPNGKPSDFGDEDVATLKAMDVACALTTTPGVNTPGARLDR